MKFSVLLNREWLNNRLGSGMIFVSIIIGIVGKFFAFKAFNIGDPSAFDRLVGAGFGVARGYAIVVLTMVSVVGSPVVEQDWYKESKLVHRLEKSSEAIGGTMPMKWKKVRAQEGSNSVS